MTEKEMKIPEGAIVNVTFVNGGTMFGVEFVRGPQGPGDCFVIRHANGKVSYLQHFESIKQQEQP